ncbi:hypothetical protein BST97_10445 [Nonlabens spongiae]|uniref:Outer membrane protein beta-barrel domain-containing protein n=1 Tax=Nonlabens spongiae TaxID=331648 RepID=A0A1W6MLC0_9FLAO|nr:porin family protein [Nonlabens spongiae]ARN78372.1 hypothetical protein BST97_10445 [Nonlabens spongiae]
MKKLLLTAVIALCGLGLTNAQEIDFGVQAGVNFATFNGDDIEDADGRTGINVGVTGEYMFNDSFALFSGVIYSMQGLQAEENGFEEKIKLDYLNVPILGKFYLGGSGFSIDAGPQVGFLINDEYTLEGNGEEVSEETDAESIDLSVGGGLSYKFLEGTTLEGLSVGARYMQGLSGIGEDVDIFNSVLSINLGYRF